MSDQQRRDTSRGSGRATGDSPPAALILEIDGVIPRGETAPDSILTSREEYLARTAALWSRLEGLRYREDQWNQAVAQKRLQVGRVSNLADLVAAPPVEDAAVTSIRTQNRFYSLENELEAVLYTARGSLDLLTRVVCTLLEGKTEVHSYSKLHKHIPGGPRFAAVAKCITEAEKWTLELKSRRDAASHYCTLIVASTHERALHADGTRRDVTLFLGIPELQEKESANVWDCDIPVIGGTKHRTERISSTDSPLVERRDVLDANDEMILSASGPYRPTPKLIDGEVYVRDLLAKLRHHVAQVLEFIKADFRTTSESTGVQDGGTDPPPFSRQSNQRS